MPTELPQVITIVLGALAPILIQAVKRAFRERIVRLGIALLLTALTGAGAFYVVRPAGLELPEALAWIYTASSLGYQFWRALWSKNLR